MTDLTKSGRVFVRDFTTWEDSVPKLLEAAALGARLAAAPKVLIKPNLVEALQPPITTPVALVAVIIDYIRVANPQAEIIVGEGCGSLNYTTWRPFEALGYKTMARQKGVELLDLNEAPLVRVAKAQCRRWPEIFLPQVVFESFLISVPVLKAHSLAGVTLTMKNMMGLAPPAHYQQNGHWKKAAFHQEIQAAVLDLNRYRTPDFTVLDATVGMQEAHLWGATCQPPPHLLAAAFDPVAIDAFGTGLLKRDWRQIGHLAEAHGELGLAEPLDVVRSEE